MTASITPRVMLAALLMASSLAMALQQQQQQQEATSLQPVVQQGAAESPAAATGNQEQLNALPGQQTPQDKAVWPMVDVDRQENKSTVDVHVPIFFDMTNHKDNGSGRDKLDLSVLHGLVTVNKDRLPDANGQMSGPIKVTVFGIPVYQGKSSQAQVERQLPEQQQQQQQTGAGLVRSGGLSERAQEVSSQITNNVRQTNEKLMTGFTDFFGRLNSMVRQAAQAIGDRQTSANNYERELLQRRQQPLPYEILQQQQQQQQTTQKPQLQAQQQEQGMESNQIERLPVRSARDELPRA